MQSNASMIENSNNGSAIRIASPGHVFFAATMIFLGIWGLIKGDFPPIWSGVMKATPARELLPYLCGFISVITGIGLLFRRTALLASRVLLIYLLLWLLLFRFSHFFLDPVIQEVTFWACGDTMVMIGAAWVLYVWFSGDRDGQRSFATGDKGLRIARVFYGLAIIPFGVAHFTYMKESLVVVPRMLPWPTAWVYFTGGAFIAAGIAIIIGVFARLAAMLSLVEMGLFTLIVWVPLVLTGSYNAFQWQEFLNSIALTAGAWVVADSYRGTPWLAVGKR